MSTRPKTPPLPPRARPPAQRVDMLAKLAREVPSAFWLRPDYSGGDNLRDPGTEPFWTRPPLPFAEPVTVGADRYGPVAFGVVRLRGNIFFSEPLHPLDPLAALLAEGPVRDTTP